MSHTHISLSNSHGFSLIELLVATAVLGIGLLTVATMIPKSTIIDSKSYYMSRASMIIEEYIENATLLQYTSTSYANLKNSTTTIASEVDGVQYTLTCEVVEDAPINRCKEMSCTATWNNKGTQARTSYVYVFSPKF